MEREVEKQWKRQKEREQRRRINWEKVIQK